MSTLSIRQYGDAVLRHATKEIDNIDGAVAKLAEDMLETMYAASGVGLAANQVGVQRRMFVYDTGGGPVVVVNPVIVETSGEWSYEEGCLSVPGLSWPIVRPNVVHLVGLDLEGNQLSIEADELEGRAFQHEVDHLDGRLLIERLDDERRRAAKVTLRERLAPEL
ncbi:MAG: peptide deformylase [Acidimicrobiales bacterium]